MDSAPPLPTRLHAIPHTALATFHSIPLALSGQTQSRSQQVKKSESTVPAYLHLVNVTAEPSQQAAASRHNPPALHNNPTQSSKTQITQPTLQYTNDKARRKSKMATTPAGRMLSRQFQHMQSDKDSIPGISCGLVDHNVFEWEVMLMISDDVQLYGGMFQGERIMRMRGG